MTKCILETFACECSGFIMIFVDGNFTGMSHSFRCILLYLQVSHSEECHTHAYEQISDSLYDSAVGEWNRKLSASEITVYIFEFNEVWYVILEGKVTSETYTCM